MKDLSLTRLHFKVFSCFVLISALLILAPACGEKKSEPAEAENDADSLDEDFDAVEEDLDSDGSENVSEPDNDVTESDNDQDFTDYEEDEPVQGICLEEPCKDVENSTGECLTKGESGDYVCVCRENFVWFPNKKTCEPLSSFKGLSCTGQIKCYDNEKEIPCPKAGEPFFGQDANYAENRSCLPQNFTIKHYGSDKTVIDNNSKLEWVQAVRVSETTHTRSVGGYSDWRNATFEDYNSIIDSGTFAPTINEAYFPETPSDIFVTKCDYEERVDVGPGPSQRLYDVVMEGIDFKTGLAKNNVYEYERGMPETINIRTVRDLPEKQESFTRTFASDEYNIAILLPQKLVLQKSYQNRNWKEALEYCENLTYAGISDWRLPNRNETYFLDDYGLSTLWSSTSYTNDPTRAIVYTDLVTVTLHATFNVTATQNKTEKLNFACVAFDPCPEGEIWNGEKCIPLE